MATREELQEAYSAFRLPIGSDLKTIKKRYKLLVKAWHPDKQGGQVKEEVQQELKEYNHFYNDIFKKHFEAEHSDDPDCLCQTPRESPQEPAQEQFQQQERNFYEPTEPVDPEIEARSQRGSVAKTRHCGDANNEKMTHLVSFRIMTPPEVLRWSLSKTPRRHFYCQFRTVFQLDTLRP